MNEIAAEAGIQQYLTETLNGLPPGVALSAPVFVNANDRRPTGSPNLTVHSCDDDFSNTTGPRKVGASFWIDGIPAGQTGDYFETVILIWRDRQWNVTEPKPGVVVKAITPDGYQLAAVRANPHPDAVNRLDSILLTAGSPCFPVTATQTATPLPTRIEHR